jgi:nicotinamidase-related amidase
MANLKIDKEITALLVIDPYNDFISEGGKFWDHMRHVAEANNCVPNTLQVLNAARKAELRVFYSLHRQYRPERLRDLEVHCARPEGSVVANWAGDRSLPQSPDTPIAWHIAQVQ